ncbi:uncharacterized protein MYCFIDRAFT_210608 [Pseudocercospora fijiensis CIRAD86]|uniref:Uncharacterized protein n=1 Tax=Pseudocercospora fijiensis (strain CIRAD86) TaxID=383855 RepID=M2ZAD2_PSEFD|nr:uncharacterized protein MYCFIDRAFT_210608 [Pseudocercospora fijiensis CIRAD86]EME86770.1 hypothetical protein MYCFIDRAFT_210608 [Pseudocercospora fijiensis CIRAD86]
MHGTYHFCGVPGGACAKDDNIMRKSSSLFPTTSRLTLALSATTTSAIPTFFLTKRHEEHNATAARWSNDTELDFNSTSRPGGQPPTGAAAESKGQRVDSNKEKVWLIAILTAGVVAFAQIKRRA